MHLLYQLGAVLSGSQEKSPVGLRESRWPEPRALQFRERLSPSNLPHQEAANRLVLLGSDQRQGPGRDRVELSGANFDQFLQPANDSLGGWLAINLCNQLGVA